jgi:hypothetical protein
MNPCPGQKAYLFTLSHSDIFYLSINYFSTKKKLIVECLIYYSLFLTFVLSKKQFFLIKHICPIYSLANLTSIKYIKEFVLQEYLYVQEIKLLGQFSIFYF